jgi:hypothetical protein
MFPLLHSNTHDGNSWRERQVLGEEAVVGYIYIHSSPDTTSYAAIFSYRRVMSDIGDIGGG